MTSSTHIDTILARYATRGIIQGSELLLPPLDAIGLANDLANAGCTILGLDGWVYTHAYPNYLAQSLDVDYFVGDRVLTHQDAPSESAWAVITYIQSELPPDIPFVSLTYSNPISTTK